MATKETQNRILTTAIALFNDHGTAKISANRIADECNLSRGNLYYHYNNKQGIINAIYQRMAAEIKSDWVNDIEYPTVDHMLRMFDRQLELIWRYRFFYRELTALLADDELLQQRFSRDRQDRTEVIVEYCKALIDNGVLFGPKDPRSLRNLVKLSWILSDNLINYIAVDTPNVYPNCLSEGYELLIDLFRPYFTREAQDALAARRLLDKPHAAEGSMIRASVGQTP